MDLFGLNTSQIIFSFDNQGEAKWISEYIVKLPS